jgi:3-deoxy-D-manno-octulosonic-acid transferase
MWRAAYAAALWLALPAVLFKLWWRGRAEPGYRSSIGERFGFFKPSPAASRPLIWIHAVSLGETRAAQPLFALLRERFPDHDFLLTHMTATGRDAARELFAGCATFAWLPYDYPFAVRRFLDHFRPCLGILLETEVWFNLVRLSARSGVPLLLANARLSEKSARGYKAVAPLASEAFAALSCVAAQTEADADRLRHAGAPRVSVTGNLKFDVQPSPHLDALALEFRRRYGPRKVFLAASTRDGEEALIVEALESNPLPGVLIVIVPRHPQRFSEVEALLSKRRLTYALRSSSADVDPGCRVVIGDSLGEMHAYYASTDVAFIGGSLLAFGGQNLIEACAAGVPVFFGPYTYNFADAARAALAEGAARLVPDAPALLRSVEELLKNEPGRQAMARAGREFCDRHRGATARIAALAEDLLKNPA